MKAGLIIVLIIIIAGGFWFFNNSGDQSDTQEPVMENKEETSEQNNQENTTANEEEASNEVTFDITGRNFAFNQGEIRVKEGDVVTINFESTDGFHDWVVDEFSAATSRVSTGGKTSVTFTADKTGEFEYYCSVGSHRAQGMVGTLIVE
ncbi:hypothetical protein CL654_03445 [bacterium]|nr:hypothetical protein [bacterium]|tara:strand:+ start:3511 stop:3957 length:447 start_codon:yes stop_codon:yes gene_type:complete